MVLLRACAFMLAGMSVVPLSRAASICEACHGEGNGNRRSSARHLWERLDRADTPQREKSREREEARGALGVMGRVNYNTVCLTEHSEPPPA